MLGKLLKHEFIATGRTLLPIYVGSVVLAGLLRVSMEVQQGSGTMLSGLLGLMYSLLLMAVIVVTIVIIIKRFWDNLLGEEGYLSLTLPVSATQHILAKSLAASVWTFLSAVVMVLSILIVVLNGDTVVTINSIWNSLSPVLQSSELAGVKVIICVNYVVQLFIRPIFFYCAMAFGQSFMNHKGLMSVAIYFAISMIMSMINNCFTIMFANTSTLNNAADVANYASVTTLLGMIVSIIVGAVCFYITKYFLTKRLNLQ